MEMYLITFASTHYAMRTEKKLKTKYKVEMIPTPRYITISCGLSLQIPGDYLKDIITEIKNDGLDSKMLSIYKIIRSEVNTEIKEIHWSQ